MQKESNISVEERVSTPRYVSHLLELEIGSFSIVRLKSGLLGRYPGFSHMVLISEDTLITLQSFVVFLL